MAIPKQVEEAAELAENLLAELNAPDEKEEATDDQALSEETGEEETAEEEEEDQEDQEEETFRHKYKTLQSKYDKEVPKLHKELKELKQSVFDRLGEFQKSQTAQPKQEEQAAKNEVLERFKEEYTPEFYDALKEFLKVEGQSIFQNQLKPVEEKLTSVESTQIASARDAFNSVLDSNVKGDWKTVWETEDPAFMAFLDTKGPFGLMTYAEMMAHANSTWNAEAMAEIFNAYFGDSATEQPSSKQKEVSKKQKEALIAPSRDTKATTPKADEKRIWTQEMIKQFQKDDLQKKFTPEESQNLWNDLLAAANEGRIQ